MPDATLPSPDYTAWLADLKTRVEQARRRAVLSVNRELVTLYWQIGRDILQRQQQQGWRARVIDRLARDLRATFPDMKGFSPRNLKYMRALAEAWPSGEFVQQAAAQLPWFHLCTLLDKLKSNELREWYASQAAEHGWSRNILVMQIETCLHERQGRAVSNFADRLPPAHSDLARDALRGDFRIRNLLHDKQLHGAPKLVGGSSAVRLGSLQATGQPPVKPCQARAGSAFGMSAWNLEASIWSPNKAGTINPAIATACLSSRLAAYPKSLAGSRSPCANGQ